MVLMKNSIPRNVTLSGKGLILRSYHETDADTIFSAVRESLAELSQWMPWCHKNYSEAEHQKWSETRQNQWENGTEYDFVIFQPDSSLPLGICGLNNFDSQNRRANLGYWIRTGKTGQGLATAAAHILAGFGFNALQLNRIELIIARENVPSHRVAAKLGVTKEGLMRNRLLIQNKVHHAVMYSWIKEDYPG